jgi:hypothetical protein
LGKFANGWLGEKYLTDFSSRLRSLSNIFFAKHPNILRSSTSINEEGATTSTLGQPNKHLYITDDDFFLDILHRQEVYVMEGDTMEDQAELRKLLHTKINNMKHRSLSKKLVFDSKWKRLPELVQERFGNGFEGREQNFNISFSHGPVNLRIEKAGFMGKDDFAGGGRSIVTMNLEGLPCNVFLQEISNRAAGRFPVTLSFGIDNFECWGLTGTSRYLTNYGVYPSKVPSMGATDFQPHSIHCAGDLGCNMSLTFRFGEVDMAEWQLWCAIRGEPKM